MARTDHLVMVKQKTAANLEDQMSQVSVGRKETAAAAGPFIPDWKACQSGRPFYHFKEKAGCASGDMVVGDFDSGTFTQSHQEEWIMTTTEGNEPEVSATLLSEASTVQLIEELLGRLTTDLDRLLAEEDEIKRSLRETGGSDEDDLDPGSMFDHSMGIKPETTE